METNRKTAAIVGILFMLGTASGILSAVVTGPIMAGPDYPLNLAASETEWVIGNLLILLMGFSLAMVPIMLYPLFKKHNEVLAFGAVLFRGVLEAVCYTGIVILNFLMLTMSQIYGKTGAAQASDLPITVSLLSAADIWIQAILAIVFSTGALMIYTLFYQTRLIPRWLAGWGLIGAGLYFVAPFVSLLGSQHSALSLDSGLAPLMIPLAIQEMVFAVWLIVKGFNPQTLAALSAKRLQSFPAHSWGSYPPGS